MELEKIVDRFQDSLIQSTQDLIRIKSVQGNPEPGMPFGRGPYLALMYVLALADRFGFTTKNVDGYAGHAEYGHGKETVGVLVHVDVVPGGEDWIFPAFAGEIHDGRIYGRGAVDDKGPAVAALYALKAIKESGIKSSKKIRIVFGTDEETSFAGMKYYLSKEPAFDIGFTPDGNFPVINGEKGILVLKLKKQFARPMSGNIKIKSIKGGEAVNQVPDLCTAVLEVVAGQEVLINERVEEFNKKFGNCLKSEQNGKEIVFVMKGESSHASMPEDGINAISLLMLFLNELGVIRDDLGDFIRIYHEKIGLEHHGESICCGFRDALSGKLTLNVGIIDCNTQGVAVTVDIRYPITTKVDQVRDGIWHALEGTGITVEQTDHDPPIYFPEEHFLVRKLLHAYAEATNDHQSGPMIIGGGTYARAAKNMIAFGPVFPGEKELAHQKNEFISIDNLVKITKIYAASLWELAK
ncbi:dipeptidase PepV [Candidatus Formimonas warabiya]|uniref:dipeptidase PepV n=1 Tax=Formimonas warabiya TaxID=1761012 RepID=UPI0011D133C9|nr:dipeptidase PepV [Candidatus Formimonas warabiya]